MVIDCLLKLGRLDEVAKMLHERILGNRDHWLYIKTYIHCQVQRCQNFLERVRQQVERDKRNRHQEGAVEEEERGTEQNGASTDSVVDNDSGLGTSRSEETEKEGEESSDKGGGVLTSVEGAGEEEEREGVSSSDQQGQDVEKNRNGQEGGSGDDERGIEGEGEGEEAAAEPKVVTIRCVYM